MRFNCQFVQMDKDKLAPLAPLLLSGLRTLMEDLDAAEHGHDAEDDAAASANDTQKVWMSV
jgi:hypothetical protein